MPLTVPVLLVVVDDAGVGGGVTDRLRELGGFRVVAFNGSGRSRQRAEYPNRRSEAWFEFAELLPELDLDGDEQLVADLVAPRYTVDSRGRRVVEPKAETKRRLGRSPDRADAVLMAFWVRDGQSASAGAWTESSERAARYPRLGSGGRSGVDADAEQESLLDGFRKGLA